MNEPRTITVMQDENGRIFEKLNGDTVFFEGWAPFRPNRVETPFLSMKVEKIPFSLWQRVMSFFAWSQEEYDSEAQVRLFYHPTEKNWVAIPLPQTTKGMSVDEIEGPESEKLLGAVLKLGYLVSGSIHHHCNSGAFQSGTDKKDEIPINGVHITVGNLDDDFYSSHTRLVFRGFIFDTDLTEIVDSGIKEEVLQPLSEKIQHHVKMSVLLENAKDSGVEFPDTWKHRIRKSGNHNNNNKGTWKPGGYLGTYTTPEDNDPWRSSSKSESKKSCALHDFDSNMLFSSRLEEVWPEAVDLKWPPELLAFCQDDDRVQTYLEYFNGETEFLDDDQMKTFFRGIYKEFGDDKEGLDEFLTEVETVEYMAEKAEAAEVTKEPVGQGI